ncbi:uncharacterized protein FIESC28_07136 [Fusarium coffeatum]|uniref:BHLH domain-containing protein n=1 Tax=Fusarium coffeatum TaxID=231269 RepID=A0A366RFM1_9HYPO|nr:uncharacterized protein FIESC28_07136 [Fusarium coffeatum]RBR15934.1 hypothetical protein FIESC28_07136 [Fusarium coffeatum]
MSNAGVTKSQKPKRKGRPRPLPPDVTARNLAIEKQRRGEMNENFLELARMLPNIASARRLTKVLIVNKSIEHVRQQRELCLAADRDMQDLLAENRRLVDQINAIRIQVNGPGVMPMEAKPVTETMKQLAETKNQVFGTFAAGFGDKWVEKASQSQSQAQTQTGAGVVQSIPASDIHPASAEQASFTTSSTGLTPDIDPVEHPTLSNQDSGLALDAGFGPIDGMSLPQEAYVSGDTFPIEPSLIPDPYTEGFPNLDPIPWMTEVDVDMALGRYQGGFENPGMLDCT